MGREVREGGEREGGERAVAKAHTVRLEGAAVRARGNLSEVALRGDKERGGESSYNEGKGEQIGREGGGEVGGL
jgi:hypothetical protein